jgi:GNAT superfamily N-acetyltransferase
MLTLETRRAILADAGAIARLAMELGYDCDESTMRRRILGIRSEADHAIFVGAIGSEMVVGWIHLEVRRGVLADPFVEITGFVVGAQHRRIGVGRALMQRAHDWSEQAGIGQVRVRTQPHRREAIAFYETLGYVRIKDQRVLVRDKVVDPPPTGTVTLDD